MCFSAIVYFDPAIINLVLIDLCYKTLHCVESGLDIHILNSSNLKPSLPSLMTIYAFSLSLNPYFNDNEYTFKLHSIISLCLHAYSKCLIMHIHTSVFKKFTYVCNYKNPNKSLLELAHYN